MKNIVELTAENPNSQELSAQENKKLMDEFRGLLKKDKLTTIDTAVFSEEK